MQIAELVGEHLEMVCVSKHSALGIGEDSLSPISMCTNGHLSKLDADDTSLLLC